MIGGFGVGALAGLVVDLFTGWWGTGIVGGAVGGSLIGYYLLPPELRARSGAGGSDGGGDSGDFSWMGGSSDTDCGDSASDGGSCDGGGGGGD
jgi:hypothetical protein